MDYLWQLVATSGHQPRGMDYLPALVAGLAMNLEG